MAQCHNLYVFYDLGHFAPHPPPNSTHWAISRCVNLPFFSSLMITNSPNNQFITCLVPHLPTVGETLSLCACPYSSPSHVMYSVACSFPFIPFHHHLLSTPVSTLTNKLFSACSSLTYPFQSLPFSFSTLISTPVSTFTHRFFSACSSLLYLFSFPSIFILPSPGYIYACFNPHSLVPAHPVPHGSTTSILP